MIADRPKIRNIDTCAAQVRIFVFPSKFLKDFYQGRMVLANMPGDGDPFHVHQVGANVCVMVYSSSYSPVDPANIPVITARLERRGDGRMAA